MEVLETGDTNFILACPWFDKFVVGELGTLYISFGTNLLLNPLYSFHGNQQLKVSLNEESL